MNIKRIEARTNIKYQNVVERIVNDKSISPSHVVVWLLRELTILQKYILELLMDRINKQIRIRELINE